MGMNQLIKNELDLIKELLSSINSKIDAANGKGGVRNV
jgi:hypothetical protein